MISFTAPTKYVDEELWYEYDWSGHLETGEALGAVTLIATDGLVIMQSITASNVTKFKVSGGRPMCSFGRVQLLAAKTPAEKHGVNIVIPVGRR